MATMADVARAAQVSITTVSHVVNGTRPVHEDTVRRVRAAIERTGYTPNILARALARASTQSVGLALGGLSNPYLGDVIAAVEHEAARHDLTVLVGDTRDDPEQELRIVQALVRRRVDGLLLSPSPGAAERALPWLAAQRVPVVLIDRFADPRLDQVGSDNEEPTARLVEHLAELGHTRIGLVAGLPGLTTTAERVRGYRLGLARAGLAVDEALIGAGGSERAAAERATAALVAAADPPTALVSGNNVMTIGAMRALAERGLRVPGDMALVGFDDFDWAGLFEPRLTVVAQPAGEIGACAVGLLRARLDDPSRAPQAVRLPARFVHRASCGCR